ncbi:hypothetical protein QQ045_033461 [Rhodiola kirilowii]
MGVFVHLLLLAALVITTNAVDIFLNWDVRLDNTIKPVSADQPVITINGMFPGPMINATTNDFIHVSVFNNMDEPLLFTWNGIQQRLNSWQDGVSGTNCPIQPGANWTYVFQTKDQIGSFFYFPSLNFQKSAGGFGSIRVNNRIVIAVPFPKPDAEFDLLIGDWTSDSYKDTRANLGFKKMASNTIPDAILMNGKEPFGNPRTKAFEFFNVNQGGTYRFRISNVGNALSLNFRIQNHQMVLVETEGSYTRQITLESLDVHVGQSYSVLVTMAQKSGSFYMVASPKLIDTDKYSSLVGVGVLQYNNSAKPVSGPLPKGPHAYDIQSSLAQARSIRWNMTTGAARPNPQGTFNVSNVTLSQTFILRGSLAEIEGKPRYTVNNVSYSTPDTPLKLADHFLNGTGVYTLDWFPVQSVNADAAFGVSVVTGIHKGWIEIVFQNDMMDVMDSWHLDGFSFYVVGFGGGNWTPESRSTYNLRDPVVRSTTQVYPRRWTAVYAFLDNPGMWNLRSQILKHWYLGEEIYIRVHNNDPDPAKERPPPENLLKCGIVSSTVRPFAPSPVSAPAPPYVRYPPVSAPIRSPFPVSPLPAPAPAPAPVSGW